MPLRLLEVSIPNDEFDRVPDILEDIKVEHVAMLESAHGPGLVRILLDAQHAEAASDVLVRLFGARVVFRLTLLPVEATIPVIVAPPKPDPVEAAEAEPAKKSPQRISREELYEDIAQASKVNGVYATMVALSTVVAAVGLIRGDVAIIIGAMVIAPLLGPNIGLSLAATLGDPDLAQRSIRAIGIGVAIAVAMSFLLGVVIPVDPTTPEIATRTNADMGDIALALASGAAGALAFTSGVPSVVVGVMVAVALLPPLVTAGLMAGGGHWGAMSGALLLLLTNVTCVNLAAVGTFLIQKVRPRTWWEANRAKKATLRATVAWIAMLLVLLALMLSGVIEPVSDM
jgi:uncharacterized hydrophobic protein (TIGR00341 family)